MRSCVVYTLEPSETRYTSGYGNKKSRYPHPAEAMFTLAGMCEQVNRDGPSPATASHDTSLSAVVPTRLHYNEQQSIFFQPGRPRAHALFASEQLLTKRNALRRWLKKQEREIRSLVNNQQRLQYIIKNRQRAINSDCAMLLEGAHLYTEINALDKAQESTRTTLAAMNQQSGIKGSKCKTGTSAVLEGKSEQLRGGFLWGESTRTALAAMNQQSGIKGSKCRTGSSAVLEGTSEQLRGISLWGQVEDTTLVHPSIMQLWKIVLKQHPVITSNQSQTQIGCKRKQGR